MGYSLTLMWNIKLNLSVKGTNALAYYTIVNYNNKEFYLE
jgi:hypothetical protein